MREPQVVRRLRLQRMSLCATGMPVSGVASPRARHSSARRAAASASASPAMLMKLLSSRLNRRMRARQARVSSTEEIFFAARSPESCVSVAASTLLDHLRHEVETLLDSRRDGLIKSVLVGLANFVRPQALPLRQMRISGVRHWLDATRVYRAHLLDQGKHAVQPL